MQTSESTFSVLFAILLGMVVIWFVLMQLLLRRLASAHPATYEAMGRPSLFLRNSSSGALAVLQFLIARKHRTLGDTYLSMLSDGMLVFFAVYLVLFIMLGFGIIG